MERVRLEVLEAEDALVAFHVKQHSSEFCGLGRRKKLAARSGPNAGRLSTGLRPECFTWNGLQN
jgi:hypothetical protein